MGRLAACGAARCATRALSQPYDSYNIGLPRGGSWYLRFNSDWVGYSPDFGGHRTYDTTADGGPNQNMPVSGNVGLPPYTLLIYSQ